MCDTTPGATVTTVEDFHDEQRRALRAISAWRSLAGLGPTLVSYTKLWVSVTAAPMLNTRTGRLVGSLFVQVELSPTVYLEARLRRKDGRFKYVSLYIGDVRAKMELSRVEVGEFVLGGDVEIGVLADVEQWYADWLAPGELVPCSVSKLRCGNDVPFSHRAYCVKPTTE